MVGVMKAEGVENCDDLLFLIDEKGDLLKMVKKAHPNANPKSVIDSFAYVTGLHSCLVVFSSASSIAPTPTPNRSTTC